MSMSGRKINAEILKVTIKPRVNTNLHGNLTGHNLLLNIQFQHQQHDFKLKDHQYWILNKLWIKLGLKILGFQLKSRIWLQ